MADLETSGQPDIPFPSPEQLQKYEYVIPGFGHRWMSVWERGLERAAEVRKHEIDAEERTSRFAWATYQIRLLLLLGMLGTYAFVLFWQDVNTTGASIMTIVMALNVLEFALRKVWRKIRSQPRKES